MEAGSAGDEGGGSRKGGGGGGGGVKAKGKKSDVKKTPHVPRFPELPPKYSASRELRNKAEKLRRDRLNKQIEEIKSLVPVISNKKKKSETTRTIILRVSANYIRLQSLFGNEKNVSSGIRMLGEGLAHLEAMNGVMLLLSEDGKILYISDSVEKQIGYTQLDLLGMSIYDVIHPADHGKLQLHLSREKSGIPSASSSSSISPSSPVATSPSPSSASTSSPSPSSASANCLVPLSAGQSLSSAGASSGKPTTFPRQSFFLRLKEKAAVKGDSPTYEHMYIVGHYRETQVERRAGQQYVFVCTIKLVKDRPMGELSLTEAVQDQYITRHLPDGRIIYTDHRIASIAGYLPSDVQGKSAFNYMRGDDLPWATMALRNMFASSEGEGVTTYRLRTRSGEDICLQSKGFIEYNKKTKQIENFLCINTVIRPEDTERFLEEQREKYAPFIAELQMSALENANVQRIEDKTASSQKIVEVTDTQNSEAASSTVTSAQPSAPPSHYSGSSRSVKRKHEEAQVAAHPPAKRLSTANTTSRLGANTADTVDVSENFPEDLLAVLEESARDLQSLVSPQEGEEVQYREGSVPRQRATSGSRIIDITEEDPRAEMKSSHTFYNGRHQHMGQQQSDQQQRLQQHMAQQQSDQQRLQQHRGHQQQLQQRMAQMQVPQPGTQSSYGRERSSMTGQISSELQSGPHHHQPVTRAEEVHHHQPANTLGEAGLFANNIPSFQELEDWSPVPNRSQQDMDIAWLNGNGTKQKTGDPSCPPPECGPTLVLSGPGPVPGVRQHSVIMRTVQPRDNIVQDDKPFPLQPKDVRTGQVAGGTGGDSQSNKQLWY